MDQSQSAPTPTPRVEQTLRAATRLAEARGHLYVGTEHVLLALLDDPDGIAGQVLNAVGPGDALRQAIEVILSSAAYAAGTRRIFSS
jgi:ATP-dependent Clp protease ATP-binding subunit ClpC